MNRGKLGYTAEQLKSWDEMALDRLINASDELQLEKAKAIAVYVQWRVEQHKESEKG